jgi:hypothetical protein
MGGLGYYRMRNFVVYTSNSIRIMNLRRLRLAKHIVRMEGTRNK